LPEFAQCSAFLKRRSTCFAHANVLSGVLTANLPKIKTFQAFDWRIISGTDVLLMWHEKALEGVWMRNLKY
jgi:hypothetical protein